MSQNVKETGVPSPFIARTEQIHSVGGKLTSLGYTSVFDIVRIPREHFLKKHRRELGRDTGKIYDLAIGYAHQVARSFRKNRLSRTISSNLRGAFSVNGPDYSSQFPDEVWTGLSPVGAPEANDGVARYATALYQLALDREGDTGGNSRLMNTLAKRRPDLSTLMVDDKAMNEEIPQLQIVTEVLSAAIGTTLEVVSSGTYNITAAAPDAAKSSIVLDKTDINPHGATGKITLTLKDAYGNRVPDYPLPDLNSDTFSHPGLDTEDWVNTGNGTYTADYDMSGSTYQRGTLPKVSFKAKSWTSPVESQPYKTQLLIITHIEKDGKRIPYPPKGDFPDTVKPGTSFKVVMYGYHYGGLKLTTKSDIKDLKTEILKEYSGKPEIEVTYPNNPGTGRTTLTIKTIASSKMNEEYTVDLVVNTARPDASVKANRP